MNRKLLFAILSLILVSMAIVGVSSFVSSVEAQNFDTCIADDSNGSTLRFNSGNGDYMFCAGGKTFTGTGSVTKMGRVVALQHNAADRRLVASVNTDTRTGSGMLQSPVGKTVGSISDRNTADSSCQCR
jgi:hypothetical protein